MQGGYCLALFVTMSKHTHDEQTLTQYLLGALPEAETERLDELSFTDDDFAAALQAAEQDLVDAYVQGELPGAALAQFKVHYLASPHRRERVEFARALRLMNETHPGAQATAERMATPRQSTRPNNGRHWFSSLSFLASPRPVIGWGMAFAALALVVACGWLGFENVRLRGQVAGTQTRQQQAESGRQQREQELQQELAGQRAASAGGEQELARVSSERERLAQELKQQAAQGQQQQEQARASSATAGGANFVAAFILTPQLRGAEKPTTVSIPPRTAYVQMQLPLEPNDYAAYRVTLINPAGGETLWRSATLTARGTGAHKSLGLRLPANLLRAQAYALRVAGISATGAAEIISDYPFKVMK